MNHAPEGSFALYLHDEPNGSPIHAALTPYMGWELYSADMKMIEEAEYEVPVRDLVINDALFGAIVSDLNWSQASHIIRMREQYIAQHARTDLECGLRHLRSELSSLHEQLLWFASSEVELT